MKHQRSSLTGENLELHLAVRAYYNRYFTEQLLANGMLPFYWDNGNMGNHGFALFDQQLLDALNAALQAVTDD